MKTELAPSRTAGTVRSSQGILQAHARAMIREDFTVFTPSVSIQGYQYLVDFGSGSVHRFHRVNKNKECCCGGARVPDPEGMPPCPICGSKTYRDRNWDGKYTKELGWRCTKGGLRHFLDAKAERIKKNLAENPWLIPPAPGYPGVRRDELMTWEECEAINRKIFLETGYDPTA